MDSRIAVPSIVVLVTAVVTLSACNPPESVTAQAAPTGSAVPAAYSTAVQPSFSWQALAPSVLRSEGPPAQLALSGGYGSLIYSTTAVGPGDIITFEFTATGPKDAQLRTVLMRHCGDGDEADNASEVFNLTGAPHPLLIQHTFTSAHPCIRVMFATPTGAALDVSIDKWKLTVTSQSTAPVPALSETPMPPPAGPAATPAASAPVTPN